MNVAIVLMKYNPFGGYERQAALITDALVGRGDVVTVFASEWKGGKIEKGKNGVKGGLKFHKVPIVRLSSWLKVLTFALRSRREIENSSTEFDVIVAFDRTLKMDIYRAGNACHKEWLSFRKKHNGLGDRVSVATNMLHRVINTIEESIFKGVKAGDTKVVVLSKSGKEQIERFYPVADKTDSFVIIPPAINLERLNKKKSRKAVRDELGIKEGTLLLLHVGSGFKIKGLKSTIGALAELVKRGVDTELIVAGKDKKESARLKALCAGLGVQNRVKFLGGVTDVASLYGAADIFVLPSHFETFGLVFMEALYMGLPVVAGRGAGAATVIEEAVKSGISVGCMVDVPAMPSVLADSIVEVAKAEEGFKSDDSIEEIKRRRKDVALMCAPEKVITEFVACIDGAAKRKHTLKV